MKRRTWGPGVLALTIAAIAADTSCAGGSSDKSADIPILRGTNTIEGTIKVDVPGGEDAEIYFGDDWIGTGDSPSAKLSVPEGADRLVLVKTPANERVWATFVSNHHGLLVPLGPPGELRVDARTTVAAYIHMLPEFLADDGAVNAVVSEALWKTPELDAAATWLEAHPHVPDVSVSDEFTDLLHEAAFAARDRINTAIINLESGVVPGSSASELVKLTLNRYGTWGEGDIWGVWAGPLTVNWDVLDDGALAQLKYAKGGIEGKYPDWLPMGLFSLDTMALFAEIDKHKFYQKPAEDPNGVFNIGIDRHWPLKSDSKKAQIVRAATVLEFIDILSFVMDLVKDEVVFKALKDLSHFEQNEPSVALDRYGSYSVRFLYGGLGGPTGQMDFVQEDPELAQLWRAALFYNIVKIGMKTASAAGAEIWDDKDGLGGKLAQRLIEILANDLYSPSNLRNWDTSKQLAMEVISAIYDVTIGDAVNGALEDVTKRAARSAADKFLREMSKSGAKLWKKPGELRDGLQAFATFSQLGFQPLSSLVLGAGKWNLCSTDVDCPADALCDSVNGWCNYKPTAMCNAQVHSGGDTPESHDIELAKTSGTFEFVYDTETVPDEITVWYEGGLLFDSGCLGTGVATSTSLSFSGSSSIVTVLVDPNCKGDTGTAWSFTVNCP